MNKSSGAIVAVVVLILVGGGILLVNHKSSPTMSDMGTKSSSSTSSSSATATNSVTIDNFAFSPSNITIKKGTKVTWTNKDSIAHTVTESDNQTGPKSGDIANGQSYSFTFNTVGTFKYMCSIHPDMTGSVTVTN